MHAIKYAKYCSTTLFEKKLSVDTTKRNEIDNISVCNIIRNEWVYLGEYTCR